MHHGNMYDRNIYVKKKLESTFPETDKPEKRNFIVGIIYIYRHPTMNLTDYNKNYF